MLGPRQPADWSWVFMSMAFDLSKRSKDPSTQIGCVIADTYNLVISTGFNGPPSIIPDLAINWDRPHKYPFICHAEDNALWFGAQARGVDGLRESRIYVTGPPCSRCTLLMARAGIRLVYYANTKIVLVNSDEWELTCRIADLAGITLTPYGVE